MKKVIILSTICVLSAFMAYGAAFNLTPQKTNAVTKTSQKSTIVSRTSADYPITDSLKTLTENSDIVVEGEFSNFDKYWNMARNPNDISKEDPELYVKGALYDFTVEDYLKSNGQKQNKITVNICVSRNDKTDERYIEPTMGQKIILFLKKGDVADYYYGTEEPFRFSVDQLATDDVNSSSNDVKTETNIQDIKNSFEGGKTFSLPDFKNEIKNIK